MRVSFLGIPPKIAPLGHHCVYRYMKQNMQQLMVGTSFKIVGFFPSNIVYTFYNWLLNLTMFFWNVLDLESNKPECNTGCSYK